jgi:hypothetical protein
MRLAHLLDGDSRELLTEGDACERLLGLAAELDPAERAAVVPEAPGNRLARL